MRHTLDHVQVNVSDFARAKAFYSAALAPLGVTVCMEYGQYAGFGRDRKPEFWISDGKMSFQTPEQVRIITPIHICFSAENREQVDAFYKAAMAAGARDNGPPGLRPHYHAKYYGAFVFDPDGHNIEAVHHGF